MSKNVKKDPCKARVVITEYYQTEKGGEVAIDRQITKRLDLSRFQVTVSKGKEVEK